VSTEQEKRKAIQHAVDAAKRRLTQLEVLKEHAPKLFEYDKAKQYEMDMHKECVERGERLLALAATGRANEHKDR